MGKQLQLFMTVKDELEFINYVYSCNDYIVDEFGNKLSIDINSIGNLYKYFIVPDYVKKFEKIKTGHIDELLSDVIEIVRCSTRNENNKYTIFNQEEVMKFNDNSRKTLYVGRIWVELKYWNENKLMSKNEILFEKYKKYEKFFKKNYKKGNNPRYYIGSNAYNLYKDYGFKMHDGLLFTVDF